LPARLNYGFAKPDPKYPWQQAVSAPGPRATVKALRNVMAFWLEQGIDGFRVDMAASLVKNDPGARYTSQLWRRVRAWLDKQYPEAVLIFRMGRAAQSHPRRFPCRLPAPLWKSRLHVALAVGARA